MSLQLRALASTSSPSGHDFIRYFGTFAAAPRPGDALRPATAAPAFLAPDRATHPPERAAARCLYATHVKRGLDIVLSLILIAASAPVLVLVALALWLESGNPFYAQTRLGRGGRVFRMLKLRSMVPGAEAKLAGYLASDPALKEEWDRSQKLKKDPRITPLGRLARKTSLDELPQLFNVLRGDMSLIGPRPMLPGQLALYRHPDAYLALRPGLSGLWQVTARNSEDFGTRAELDRRYYKRISAGLDLRILLATFRAVLRATGY